MTFVRLACLLIVIHTWALHAATIDLTTATTGAIHLPPGVTVLQHEIVLNPAAHDLIINAPQTTFQLAPGFAGRAALVITLARNVTITGLTIDGNRALIANPHTGLPSEDAPFARLVPANGILAEKTTGLTIEKASFRNMAGFAILINASHQTAIRHVSIEDSGSLDSGRRNNGAGGILLEEGVTGFEVSGCAIHHILGNAIWTRSRPSSPRNADGVISGNHIDDVARGAIEIGQASRITVERNSGARIGYPVEAVHHEATPAAVGTTGDVDQGRFFANDFTEVNGNCLRLDGFHDAEIRNNSCINNEERDAYPDGGFAIAMDHRDPAVPPRNVLIWGNRMEGFLYGGLLLIGSGHQVRQNHFLRLNMAHCNDEPVRYGCLSAAGEPDLRRSGIYLRGDRRHPVQTRGNLLEDNEITGFGMGSKCLAAAPGVDLKQNRVGSNRCGDDEGLSAWDYFRSITREMAFTSFRNGGSAKSGNTSSSPSRQLE